jgi:hypothetical protein
MEPLSIAFKQESNQEQLGLLRLKSLWWQCAKGFPQTKGVDYSEIYSPVAKFNHILIILSMSAAEDIQWTLVHGSFIIYKMHSFNSSTLCGTSNKQRMINWNWTFHSLITSTPLHKPEVVKFVCKKSFGENVSSNVQELNKVTNLKIPNHMVLYVNLLGVLMVLWIWENSYCILVINIDQRVGRAFCENQVFSATQLCLMPRMEQQILLHLWIQPHMLVYSWST